MSLASEVRRRASSRCEYCLFPEDSFRQSFHVEHIVARQHGGRTEFPNLALACLRCNWKKGPNLAGIDPETGAISPLFNPRVDIWSDHFEVDSVNLVLKRLVIRGRTAIGRATVRVLDFNEEMRQMLRYELWVEDRYHVDIGGDAAADYEPKI